MSTEAISSERSSSRPLADLIRSLIKDTDVACEVVLPDGETLRFGQTPPRFRATVHDERIFRRGLDELTLGRAYVQGDLDLDGDLLAVMELRSRLSLKPPLSTTLRFLWQLFLSTPTRVNKKAISHHYTLGDDFYLTFLDTQHHFYSHGIFHREDETLEESSEHKLETMYRALDLKAGMRLLDIGGGWGAATGYCGRHGVHVTSLTLAEDSLHCIQNLIRSENLPCEVLLEDFLRHEPAEPYDAIVIYGVIEHIPNYRRFCRHAWKVLKPGGRLYMDASASKEKFDVAPFIREYIWPGTHTYMSLQDITQEFLFHGFEVHEVKRETHDYELTMRHWAERFDAAKDKIVAKWGEETYRAFRLYLWSGSWAFKVDELQAYHIVVQRRADAGPRPGVLKRARAFVESLA